MVQDAAECHVNLVDAAHASDDAPDTSKRQSDVIEAKCDCTAAFQPGFRRGSSGVWHGYGS